MRLAWQEKAGDILDVTAGIICHQVNTRRVAGAGLAKQIRDRFPGWYDDFRITTLEPGDVSFCTVETGLLVANLAAQSGYGTKTRQTNYAALGKAALRVAQYAYRAGLPVHIPHGMGCGLGGGDWNIVQAILMDAFAFHNVSVTVWKLP